MEIHRELRDDEVNDVVGGACATGKHIAEATLSTGSPPELNSWRTWMQTYFGIAPQ
jgi:hypothetical protein